MHKRIIASVQQETAPSGQDWFHVESFEAVEITSEDAAHQIESALVPTRVAGWRAAEPGKQTIRLLFAHPQRLRRIWLSFVEPLTERTQEYVLRASTDDGRTLREIVRQQWNFSPQGSTCETEDHRVDLLAVTILELSIIPDITGGNARASLAELRLA